MYEVIAFIAGVVLGVLLIETVDLHRNRVELEKLQDKELEEVGETEEEVEAEEETATHFTVCLTDGKLFEVLGDSAGSNIRGKFVIYRGSEDNIVFSTGSANVDWWGESDHFALLGDKKHGRR